MQASSSAAGAASLRGKGAKGKKKQGAGGRAKSRRGCHEMLDSLPLAKEKISRVAWLEKQLLLDNREAFEQELSDERFRLRRDKAHVPRPRCALCISSRRWAPGQLLLEGDSKRQRGVGIVRLEGTGSTCTGVARCSCEMAELPRERPEGTYASG